MDKKTPGRPDRHRLREAPLGVRYAIAVAGTIFAVAAFILLALLLI